MYVLIPAYEPGNELLELIKELKQNCNFDMLVVNDGSGPGYENIFHSARELGCTVLAHQSNKGKGAALKTGFSYIYDQSEKEGVVCADCDGQHLPEDIIRVAREVREHKNCIILGSRRFTGRVPLRSRFGNTVTRMIFSLATDKRIGDTQTGLRGYSADMLPWLCTVSGERFEYEMIMLLEAPGAGYNFQEIDIDTIYHENNKSSHFNPVNDSARVYLPIIKFCTTSLLSAALDFILLMVIAGLSKNLLFSVVAARACSSLFNYISNRYFVFASQQPTRIKSSLPKYYALVILILIFNYQLIYLFNCKVGLPLIYAKLLTEGILFVFSYFLQRTFVFRASKAKIVRDGGSKYDSGLTYPRHS